jgi:hypothetical protein
MVVHSVQLRKAPRPSRVFTHVCNRTAPVRTKLICLLASVLLMAGDAWAGVPMPIPRPLGSAKTTDPKAPTRVPAKSAARSNEPPAARGGAVSDAYPADATSAPCTDLLASGIAVVELSVSVSGLSGDALCGDIAPVRLSAVRLPDGGRVELRPAAVARCEKALAFARWVRDDLADAVRYAGGRLERVEIAASYTCRPRNNVSGARLSEHGIANAIDVGALVLDKGRRITIDDKNAPAVLLAEMRRSACERFTTVLGPGSDAAHQHHLHVDLARRRGGYRMCQWTMPSWPMP